MPKTREQRQKALQAKANQIIEDLLDWTDQTERPNLTQMEDKILALREQLRRAMLAELLSAQESQQPVAGGPCPACGRPLRFKGRRGVQVESRVGGTTVERGYSYCPVCRSGIFPPGSATEPDRSALE